MAISNTKVTKLGGQEGIIFKKVPTLIKVEVTVPTGYLGDITVEIINERYEEDVLVDFCDGFVVDLGENMPCVNLKTDIITEVGTDFKTLDDGWVRF